MIRLSNDVLAKMSFDRLKKHRTSVLAHISQTYYFYDESGYRTQQPSHGTPAFEKDIEYRNVVNAFYDRAKKQPKL